jgi:hypothetical protein
MRERVTELLPMLLVGVVLLVFQLTRDKNDVFHFLPLPSTTVSTPTPQITIALRATATAKTPTPVAGPALASALCNPSRPIFMGGLRDLKLTLGEKMGEALECEQLVNTQGDTQQKTTTGLAYYRGQMNIPCFTTGWDHWAVTSAGLVHWAGDSVDPPAN